jgi:hypothetical protein
MSASREVKSLTVLQYFLLPRWAQSGKIQGQLPDIRWVFKINTKI